MTLAEKIAHIRWKYEHDPVYRSTLTDEERALGLKVDIAAIEMLPDTKVKSVEREIVARGRE